MKDSNKQLEKRYEEMTDKQLIEIIELKDQDYTKEAIALAKVIIETRGGIEKIKKRIETEKKKIQKDIVPQSKIKKFDHCMIQCSNCKLMNSPEKTQCAKCNTDLLPGRSDKERTRAFVIAGLGLAGFFGFNALHNNLLGAISILIFFYSIWHAISSTPNHEKYYNRAKRHEGINDKQAESDYLEAIRLAPKNYEYLYELGIFFRNNNRIDEAKKYLFIALDIAKEKRSNKAEKIEKEIQIISKGNINNNLKNKEELEEIEEETLMNISCCKDCAHFENNTFVCKYFHFNVKDYPKKFKNKCNGKYLSNIR